MKWVKINNIYFNIDKIISITPFETIEDYCIRKEEIGYGLRFVVEAYENWMNNTIVFDTIKERNDFLSNLGVI